LLGGFTEPVTICDERGHIVGTLTPAPSKEEIDKLIPPLSEEEYERRLQGRRNTTQEVLEYLDGLDK
jgi:CRISPR/Cas system-associated endonuclease Cas1